MWKSGDLALVMEEAVRKEGEGEEGSRLWSTADAAWLLDIDVRMVRDALRTARVEAVGKRFDRGRSSRHVRVYLAEEVIGALGLAA